jgi:ABC-type sugar transport system ATPase subunit
MRAELLALHRDLGATMIFVTHDQIEAMTMGQRIAVLTEGRLRQIGPPAEVYRAPADAFVAAFVGSPGMNVLPGAPEPERKRVVGCGSLRFRMSMNVPGAVQIGIRPEHVTLGAAGEGAGDAEVRMVEPLGSDTLVHLDAGGTRLVAKVPGIPALVTGARVSVQVEQANVHLFDAAGARLG